MIDFAKPVSNEIVGITVVIIITIMIIGIIAVKKRKPKN